MSSYYQSKCLMSPEEENECSSCGQNVRKRCGSCHQRLPNTDAEHLSKTCEECEQPLPIEDKDEESEDEEFEWKKSKKGTYVAVCTSCNIRCTSCPSCKNEYSIDEQESEDDESEGGSESQEDSERRSKSEEARDDES